MNEFTYFLLGINASILIRHLYLWYEKQDNKKKFLKSTEGKRGFGVLKYDGEEIKMMIRMKPLLLNTILQTLMKNLVELVLKVRKTKKSV